MKFLKTALVSGALALALPGAAVADDTEISAEDAAAIELALERGERIYRYDQAAWHTTDAMLEALSDPAGLGVAGWIINPVEGGHEAVFYRPVGDGYEAVWSAVYNGQRVSGEKTYEAGERALTNAEAAMVRASKAPFSARTDYTLCSERLNTVVFPTGKPDGGLFVYLLMPQPSMDEIPFGGHFRFEVVDGEVVDHRKFTNSCLTLQSRAPDGSRPAAMTMSHLLDDTPTEVHVFSMYAARLPLYVMTTGNDGLWSIELRDGRPSIRSVER